MSNYFALFDLESNFQIDETALKQNYQIQIKQCHPDNFTNADNATKLAKLQQTRLLNEAYDTLVLPEKRAFYLLELAGFVLNNEQTMQDLDFLQLGLNWHEQLDELKQSKNVIAIEDLAQQITDFFEQTKQKFSQIYQDKNQQANALQLAQRMQFLTKLKNKISALLDQIELD